MGYSQWLFRRVAPAQFVRVQNDLFADFHRGQAPLSPDRETGLVLIAAVSLVFERRQLARVHCVSPRRFPVDRFGFRDLTHMTEESAWYERRASLLDLLREGRVEPTYAQLEAAEETTARYEWTMESVDARALFGALNRGGKRFLGEPWRPESHLTPG